MSNEEFRQVVEKELDNFSYAVIGQYASEDILERIDVIVAAKKASDQQIALAAQGEVASKIFVDITTGHEITKIAKAHEEKCSSLHGFMCDCSVLQAAQHAVDKARDRIEATLKQSKEEK